MLPPLKDRPDDIPYLVDHLLKKISSQLKKNVKGLTPKAMQKLMQHDWPGNVRELENTLEYAITMTQRDIVGDELILQTKISTAAPSPEETVQSQFLPTPGSLKTLKEARAEFEKAYLIRLLEMCDGKATRAAEIAGKYRADFYDLLKKHEIKVADFKKSA
jgi:two-component system response regulator GlrR